VSTKCSLIREPPHLQSTCPFSKYPSATCNHDNDFIVRGCRKRPSKPEQTPEFPSAFPRCLLGSFSEPEGGGDVPPKRWMTFRRQDDSIPEKTELFVSTAVMTQILPDYKAQQSRMQRSVQSPLWQLELLYETSHERLEQFGAVSREDPNRPGRRLTTSFRSDR
jgi:hypothetical protein